MISDSEDPIGGDLKSAMTRAAGWSFVGSVGTQGAQFFFSILLARLLVPADYGLIAMLAIFMAVSQSLVDSGFGSALIQKRDATHIDESSVFFLNLAVSVLAYAAMWFSAPYIAVFYREPMLTPISRVLALNFIINAFGLVQISLLQKRLDFKSLTKRMLVGVAFSGPVGVYFAWSGYGVWSLVAQSLTSNLVQTVMLWFWGGWRPMATFRYQSLRVMFAFGSRLMISGFLSTIFGNLYSLVIGRMFSKSDLGFFTQASKLQRLPATTLTGVISQVTFPAFSSIQDDRERLKAGYRKAICYACFLVFPVMLGLSAIAQPLFLVLFTEKWAPSVPIFQVLCLDGMLFPLHALNLNALKAVGRSDLFLRLEVAKKALIVCTLLLTYRFGIMVMAWGMVANSYCALLINTYYTARIINYPLLEQVRDIIPYLAVSVTMAGLMFVVGIPLTGMPVLQMLVQITVGVGYYLVACHFLRLSVYQDMSRFVADRRAGRKQTAGV